MNRQMIGIKSDDIVLSGVGGAIRRVSARNQKLTLSQMPVPSAVGGS